MNDFAGKCGLIVGVANKYSIAWAIAQATAARGARLALTYQGPLRGHVKKLAEGCSAPLVLPCDVSSDDDIEALFASVGRSSAAWISSCTVPRSRRRASSTATFLDTSRDGFPRRARHLGLLAHRAGARRGAADGDARRAAASSR
jgi:enoyl-[acyl-carrier protein] reductase I